MRMTYSWVVQSKCFLTDLQSVVQQTGGFLVFILISADKQVQMWEADRLSRQNRQIGYPDRQAGRQADRLFRQNRQTGRQPARDDSSEQVLAMDYHYSLNVII